MREGEYDIAQICSNGHVINSSVTELPQFNKKFCDKCGIATITECPNCNKPIQGKYSSKYVPYKYILPLFCQYCGKSFPWTETKIKSALEYSKEFGGLNSDDVLELGTAITDIISETPRTQLGASRFKTIMKKAGSETANAIREIIIDIVSETAKKIIWGK